MQIPEAMVQRSSFYRRLPTSTLEFTPHYELTPSTHRISHPSPSQFPQIPYFPPFAKRISIESEPPMRPGTKGLPAWK